MNGCLEVKTPQLPFQEKLRMRVLYVFPLNRLTQWTLRVGDERMFRGKNSSASFSREAGGVRIVCIPPQSSHEVDVEGGRFDIEDS